MAEMIAHLLIGTTLLMAMLLVLRKPLSRHAGPTIAYALWALVALRLLLPPIPLPLPYAGAGAADAFGIAAANVVAQPDATFDLGPALLLVWAAGAVSLFMVGLVSSLLYQRALSRNATFERQLGNIRIFRSALVENPVAIGLLDRRIYLPCDFATRWSAEEAAMILEHERVHHERGDMWANLLAFIILSLHWFNPIGWAAWQRFRVDQECACDARVLAASNPQLRHAYGQALLKASGRQKLPALTLPLITPKTIIERIEMMRNMESGRSRAAVLALGAVALLAVPASAATLVHPHDEGAEKKIERIVVFKSDDGEKHTFKVMDGDGAEIEGDMIQLIGKDGAKSSGERNVFIMKRVEGEGDDMKVTVKVCDNKEECKIEIEKEEETEE